MENVGVGRGSPVGGLGGLHGFAAALAVHLGRGAGRAVRRYAVR